MELQSGKRVPLPWLSSRVCIGAFFFGPNMGYTNILLETDFSSALHLISQGVPVTHSCSSLAVTIRNLMYVELNVDLMHVFHEGNKCADKLASLGHRFPKSLTSFDRMPSCISLDFLADNTGQGCTRFVFD